jgi:hypothetical protein
MDKVKKPQPKPKLQDLVVRKTIKGGAGNTGGTCTPPKPPAPVPAPYPNNP